MEGHDDKYSVIGLLARHGYSWDDAAICRPFVSAEGGHTDLLVALPVALKGAYSRVGIVIDADTDPSARWEQIRSAALQADVTLPNVPGPDGVIVDLETKRVGVWMMPDNSTAGELEDFIRTLVPEGDACWAKANSAVAEAVQAGCGSVADLSKHLLHTWLAWKNPPGMPFGRAFTAHTFAVDGPAALQFVAWFRLLFP